MFLCCIQMFNKNSITIIVCIVMELFDVNGTIIGFFRNDCVFFNYK